LNLDPITFVNIIEVMIVVTLDFFNMPMKRLIEFTHAKASEFISKPFTRYTYCEKNKSPKFQDF